MLTKINLEKLKEWGEIACHSNNYKWTKWDRNLMAKLIHEIEDHNKRYYHYIRNKNKKNG